MNKCHPNPIPGKPKLPCDGALDCKLCGIGRFYQGLTPALLQGPLSRFGDTASNAGAVAFLETTSLPEAVKTVLASVCAGHFRILLSPVDTIKTSMQINGNLDSLMAKFAEFGPSVFFAGSIGTAVATFAGHYPWFFVFNFLNAKVSKYDSGAPKLIPNALQAMLFPVCWRLIEEKLAARKEKG